MIAIIFVIFDVNMHLPWRLTDAHFDRNENRPVLGHPPVLTLFVDSRLRIYRTCRHGLESDRPIQAVDMARPKFSGTSPGAFVNALVRQI
jgi:hypothetical protein